MSRLNKAESESGKRSGMNAAEEHANSVWLAYTYDLVKEIAGRQRYLFSDDIEALRAERGGPETHEPRAMGPVMMAARRNGICKPTNNFVASAQIANHRRPMRVWESCIFNEGG